MRTKGVWACAAALLLSAAGAADEAQVRPDASALCREAVRHVSATAQAEVRTAYVSRGRVVADNPFSAQSADVELLFGDWGRCGGYVWSVTAFSRRGQAASRRNAYHEADYNLHYTYDLPLAEAWTLENTVARHWVTLPGYHYDLNTIQEWHEGQALRNPYVTPYYLFRHATDPQPWNYWYVGIRRGFGLLEDLDFSVNFYGDLGDARHFMLQYGAKPGEPGSQYHGGLQALNLVLRLDWRVASHCTLFAYAWQFGVVSDDARDSLKASSRPESKRDITVAGVGASVYF